MTDEARAQVTFDPYTLDANAAAGMLQEIFGTEMTAVVGRCANCGNRAPIGSLRAHVGPGIVLRCSVCAEIVMRFMRRADGSYLVDVRGASYLRL